MTTRPIRILIADDDERLRRALARVLRADLPSLELGEAVDAEAALRLAASAPWDLILLDLSFPGMSGLDALRSLRLGGDDVPVIIVSGMPASMYVAAVVAAGAHAFVSKDRVPEELRAAVRRALAPDLLVGIEEAS